MDATSAPLMNELVEGVRFVTPPVDLPWNLVGTDGVELYNNSGNLCGLGSSFE